MNRENSVQIVVQTHTKINAWLQVMPRPTSTAALHELVSIFLPLQAGDCLRVMATPARKAVFHLTSNRSDLIPGNSLEVAWQIFITALKNKELTPSFMIDAYLEKHIPERTGLGAGSGDAGAMLVLLNRLHDLPFTVSQLRVLASHAGSDVPFFIESRPSIVYGTGNQIEPLETLPSLAFCIALPSFRIGTKEAFNRLDDVVATSGESAADPSLPLKTVLGILQMGETAQRQLPWQRLNSFEAVLEGNAVSVDILKSIFLETGAILAGLSGSGSSVYGIYAKRATAETAARSIQNQFPEIRTFVTEML